MMKMRLREEKTKAKTNLAECSAEDLKARINKLSVAEVALCHLLFIHTLLR